MATVIEVDVFAVVAGSGYDASTGRLDVVGLGADGFGVDSFPYSAVTQVVLVCSSGVGEHSTLSGWIAVIYPDGQPDPAGVHEFLIDWPAPVDDRAFSTVRHTQAIPFVAGEPGTYSLALLLDRDQHPRRAIRFQIAHIGQ